MAQADAPFRNDPSDLDHLYTANANGEMVPLNTMVTLQQSYGPDPVIRYNGYPAADLIGQSDPTVLSSAQALAMVAQTSGATFPDGMTLEWNDLSIDHDKPIIAVLICSV